MLKLSENPPMLHPENGLVLHSEARWWVGHIKSRNEKALAWDLHKWQIPYFLPLMEKVSRKNGRTFRSLLPMFTGYLFFCADDEQRYQSLTTNRIASIIEVIDQQHFVDELQALYQAINSGLAIQTHQGLTAGKRCRVAAGPLMGCEGIVMDQKDITRIYLQIDILGQSASVEINADMLELLE